MDVFAKILKANSYSWINDNVKNSTAGNYIQSITTPENLNLGEFTNGDLSGWMYTLNGTHSLYGISEQFLENNDVIIFHYADDYTQERDSEKWQSGSSSGGGSAEAAYTVKFETNGGNMVENQSVSKNDTVTEPVSPAKDGYIFAGWCTDKDLLTEYDFSAKVTNTFTLYAKWTETEVEEKNKNIAENNENTAKALTDFNDVEAGSWYEEAVAYAVENNLFNGISKTEFAPNHEMTRAMLVTVIYRLENPEKKEREHGFIDVADGKWYAEAVGWAKESGIVTGVSNTEFAPDDSITREQTAAIIYRYARMKGYAAEGVSELSEFTDIDDISDYALKAVKWANAAALITGVSETSISPKTTATRAQAAAILMRFCENVIE